MRVVYVLEKRKLKEFHDNDKEYDQFRMFDIFDRYPRELEAFL